MKGTHGVIVEMSEQDGKMQLHFSSKDATAKALYEGKCKCCKKPLFLDDRKFCYHIKRELPLEKVNKVQNLIWLCNDCYRMVKNGPIPPEIDEKVLKKIQKYKNM